MRDYKIDGIFAYAPSDTIVPKLKFSVSVGRRSLGSSVLAY